MKKFNSILKRYGVLLEQDPGTGAVNVSQTDAAMPPADQAQVTPDAEPVVQPLSPEGEVMLVRLLIKALVLKPDDADTDSILELPEVNAQNAKQVLEKIIALVRKYDPDVTLS